MVRQGEVNSQIALYTARFLLSAGNVSDGMTWLGKALGKANAEGTDKGRILAAISHSRRIMTRGYLEG